MNIAGALIIILAIAVLLLCVELFGRRKLKRELAARRRAVGWTFNRRRED